MASISAFNELQQRYQQQKEIGTKLFSAGNFLEAKRIFSQVLDEIVGFVEDYACYKSNVTPFRVAILNNLSATELQLNDYEAVTRLCSDALEIDPMNVKALYRRAVARGELNLFVDARNDCLEVLKIESANAQARRLYEELVVKCNQDSAIPAPITSGNGIAVEESSDPVSNFSTAQTIESNQEFSISAASATAAVTQDTDTPVQSSIPAPSLAVACKDDSQGVDASSFSPELVIEKEDILPTTTVDPSATLSDFGYTFLVPNWTPSSTGPDLVGRDAVIAPLSAVELRKAAVGKTASPASPVAPNGSGASVQDQIKLARAKKSSTQASAPTQNVSNPVVSSSFHELLDEETNAVTLVSNTIKSKQLAAEKATKVKTKAPKKDRLVESASGPRLQARSVPEAVVDSWKELLDEETQLRAKFSEILQSKSASGTKP